MVRTCSGVRSVLRSSSSATDPATIGADIDVPLNSTCTPSGAMSAAGWLLVLEWTEKIPFPGADKSGFWRDGRLSRTGRVGPDDEKVARSPTCSRTVYWKLPLCATQLTRLT